MTINLMVSLVLAVCVMPILEVRLIKKAGSRRKEQGKKDLTDHVQHIYEKALAWNFRHPWLTIVGALGLVAGGVMPPSP